ncbi:MAG: transcriptional repressor [Clostridiales bacterium]
MDIYRNSKQRDRVLEIVRDAKIHPTADWIYEKLKKEFPSLSMGNVYRNLNILVDQKKINKLHFGSTFDRFDGNIDRHYHFICEKCKAIIDLDLPIDEKLNDRVIKYKANSHKIQFYGICDKCEK